MTLAEWLALTDSNYAISFLTKSDEFISERDRSAASGRKLRLFATACVRKLWHLLDDQRIRDAIDTAERFADGLVSSHELTDCYGAAHMALIDSGITSNVPDKWISYSEANECCHQDPIVAATYITRSVKYRSDDYEMLIIRDIFMNPFEEIWFDRTWRTETVMGLAVAAYTERPGLKCQQCHGNGYLNHGLKCYHCHGYGVSFYGYLDNDRLSILADALEEANCPSQLTVATDKSKQVKIDNPILCHLRAQQPHVRGCWALDLILGKE